MLDPQGYLNQINKYGYIQHKVRVSNPCLSIKLYPGFTETSSTYDEVYVKKYDNYEETALCKFLPTLYVECDGTVSSSLTL